MIISPLKKYLLIGLLLIPTVALSNKKKDTDIPDAFYLSKKDGGLSQKLKQDPLIGSAPAIGKYGQDIGSGEQQYNFLRILALIENKSSALANTVPHSLVDAIFKQIGKPAPDSTQKAIEQLSSQHQVDFFTILWGEPFFEKPTDLTYNLVFHPVVRNWLQGSVNAGDFSVEIPIGIFEPKGVKPISVQLNDFKKESVIVHPADTDVAYSPNNVTFQIEQGRSLVGFWSAATSPDKSKIIIVYNAIVNDDKTEKQLSGFAASSYNLDNFIEQLCPLLDSEDLNTSSKDVVQDLIMQLGCD